MHSSRRGFLGRVLGAIASLPLFGLRASAEAAVEEEPDYLELFRDFVRDMSGPSTLGPEEMIRMAERRTFFWNAMMAAERDMPCPPWRPVVEDCRETDIERKIRAQGGFPKRPEHQAWTDRWNALEDKLWKKD